MTTLVMVAALCVLVRLHHVRYTKPLRSFLHDLDTAREDLAHRAKSSGHGPEFDQLVQHVNALLEARESEQQRSLARDSEMDGIIESRTTDLEHAVRELRIHNEELNSFATIASHDLREPLRGIARVSALLLEDFGDELDGRGVEMLKTVDRNTQRLTTLINALLEFSRIGSQEVQRLEVSLADLWYEVGELLTQLVEDSSVQLKVSNGELPLNVDPVLCRQVIVNLVQNGIKYNDSSTPTLEVGFVRDLERTGVLAHTTSAIDPGTPILFVRDNGIGIPDRFKTRVFEIFRRLHPRNAYGGGSGAGLTIARKITQRHGGHIWFESGAKGGTTFYVTFGAESAPKMLLELALSS